MNLLSQYEIYHLTERVKLLEEKIIKKNKRLETTRMQQMLLLKHCGLLEIIQGFKLQKKQTAKLLSVLLNSDETNIEHDLSHIHNTKPELRTRKDYTFLIKTFNDCGLITQKEEAEAIYKKIPTK